jgi:DNA-binding transcriptional ArsR family regulator
VSADAIFGALGDPTRRQVLEAVARSGPLTATELAADLPVSRQAVAKHLATLQAAGLVEGRRAGRETRYEATPEPLDDAIAWMRQVGERWDRRLSRLQEHLRARG